MQAENTPLERRQFQHPVLKAPATSEPGNSGRPPAAVFRAAAPLAATCMIVPVIVAMVVAVIVRMAILAAMAIRRASMLATASASTAAPATRGMIAFGVIAVLRQHGAGGDKGHKPADHKPPVHQIAIHRHPPFKGAGRPLSRPA
jgi:hypothetical protein